MPIDVVMPQMGESITEGTLTKWLKKPGDTVARDEPLFEISTDKVDAEIPSPAAGTLGEIKVQEGATVGVGTVVCAINDASVAEAAPITPAPADTARKEETVTPAAVDTAANDEAVPPPAPEASGPGTEVLMPQMGESITEGTLTKWLKKVGDTVARDEPIFEISTDKVDAEIPSPSAGVLSEIRVQEGQTVTVSTVVAVIGGGAAAPASTPRPAAPVQAPSTPAPGAPVPAPAPSAYNGRRHCVPRLWCARSQPRTTLTSEEFQAPARPVESPSRTSSVILKARLRQLRQFLRYLPLPRQLLQFRLRRKSCRHPLRLRFLANWSLFPRCAPSLLSAWWNQRPPARMFTRSSRWI